jgi:phosphoribosyl 1,2-cyclic phosphodiesterase
MPPVGMQVTVLGSGSAGNCTLVETEATAVLIDAGLSARQVNHRLQQIGRSITDVDAILLTHEHSDHTGALPVLCKAIPLPVYANRLTAEAVTTSLTGNRQPRIAWHLFQTGSAFTIGNLQIETFSIPHDAQDPVGFVIRDTDTGLALGVLTDLGHATKLAIERVRQTDALILESNHDLKLLQDDTRRSWGTKQRIMSRHGHLSNDDAAAVVRDIASPRFRHVFLAHLSRDCNRPELARKTVADKLRHISADHIAVAVSVQHEPTATLCL